MIPLYLQKSVKRGKKFDVIFNYKIITSFGSSDYEDYTQHHDQTRQMRYIARAERLYLLAMEEFKKDMTISTFLRPSILSMLLLWLTDDLEKNIWYVNKNYLIPLGYSFILV